MWKKNHTPFSVSVSAPEKKSKYKGIKSYVAYQIVPSVREFLFIYNHTGAPPAF